MTTPRPPRPGRRTPKVAGRTPARPTPPVEDTTAEQTVAPAPRRTTRPAKATPAPEPVAPETAEPVVPATAATETAAPQTAAPETATDETAADETPTTSLTKSEPAPVATDAPRGKRPPATKVSTLKPQSTRPTAPPAVPADAAQKAPRRPLLSWKLVGIVAAIAVVFAIIAGVAAIKPGVSLASNSAFVNSSVTSEVTSQAKARVCTIFGVQYDKLDQWQQTAQSNVTGVAAGNFAKYNKAVRDALTQAGLTSGGADCRVDTVGVRSIDGDNAVLLVNLIISTTQNGTASGSDVKRYQVSMHHTDGKWLISDFVDF